MRKAIITVSAACGLALLATGCATTVEQPQDGASSLRTAVDRDYVARVNYHARRSGVQVIWINPPTVTEAREDGPQIRLRDNSEDS